MKILKSILFIIILLGCASTAANSIKLPEGISVKENKVFIKNILYAEVLKVYPNQRLCRGLAIHYVASDSYEWISPQGGIQLKNRESGKVITNIPTVIRLWDRFVPDYEILIDHQRTGGDGYFKMNWRSNVQISEDGSTISYREKTTNNFFNEGTERIYRVSYPPK